MLTFALTSLNSVYLNSQRLTLYIGSLHVLSHLNMTSTNTLFMRKPLRNALTTRKYDGGCEIAVGGVVIHGFLEKVMFVHSHPRYTFCRACFAKGINGQCCPSPNGTWLGCCSRYYTLSHWYSLTFFFCN